ncbi:Cytochrome P450 [Corchorus olitorius]|uniref:Cytochrome P450 n=1 Tax=Corchorus olitorius TaxID=93759 RepID=A0A1R3KDG5_9ROSI|nr:Cytochrome P450 [Corchorus olitorius]
MVVVSSSTLAEECFTKNDIILANRPETSRGKHLGYNHTTVLGSSYGDHWRNLRRIGAIEIFSSSRMNAFTSVRKDEVRRLIMKLSRDSRQGHFVKVELKSMLHDLTLNNIMRMAAGKRYCGDEVSNEEEAREFKELMAEIFETGGRPNPADFFPGLKLLGEVFEKKDKKQGKRLDGFMQKLIDEHRSYKRQGITSNSMIDHLLSLQESEPHIYTDQIIKGFNFVS